MGYMGLNHWNESDNAADCVFGLAKLVEPYINKHIKEISNSYNTDGCIDIALLLEDGVIHPELITAKQLKETIERITAKIKDIKNQNSPLGSNGKYHVKNFERLIKVCEKILKNKHDYNE